MPKFKITIYCQFTREIEIDGFKGKEAEKEAKERVEMDIFEKKIDLGAGDLMVGYKVIKIK